MRRNVRSQYIKLWLNGKRVGGRSGCPMAVLMALDRHDQEVLAYKFGLVRLGKLIGFPVEDIIQNNEDVAGHFEGMNSKQTAYQHIRTAMVRVMWRRNGVKLPDVLAVFMHSAPEGDEEI